ncbi:MAG TPA: cation:proton antiporter [Terriglobales bacterium]|nr:cation:proton antiporter [Terriglobales bacterium]
MIVTVFAVIGGLLVLAFVANRLFGITRVPDVVVLMLLGVILGPILGIVHAANFRAITGGIGTLAIVLVLFEAGLELDLRDTIRRFPASLLLALLAFAASAATASTILRHALGLPLTTALLIGAVFGCTSSTIVLPVLQQVKAKEPIRITLSLESALGDVFAVLAVGILLDLKTTSGPVWHDVFRALLSQIVVAALLGLLDGLLWSRLLPRISEERFWHALTFANVLLLYAAAETLHASGLIAVLGFGLTLSNIPGLLSKLDESFGGEPMAGGHHHHHVLTFHSELGFLVRTFFFVLIGAVAELDGLRQHLLLSLEIVGGLLVARWISVWACWWSIRNVEREDRELLIWMMPRGLITAVLAFRVYEAKGQELAFVPELAFAIILATNVMLVIGSIRAKRKEVSPVLVRAGAS